MTIEIINKKINLITGKETLDKYSLEIYNLFLLSPKKEILLNSKEAFEIFNIISRNSYFLSLLGNNLRAQDLSIYFWQNRIEASAKSEELKKIIALSMIGFLYLDEKKSSYEDFLIKQVQSTFYFWREELKYEYNINTIIFFLVDQIIVNSNLKILFWPLPKTIQKIPYQFYHISQHAPIQIGKLFFLSINFSNTLKNIFNTANSKNEEPDSGWIKSIASWIHGWLMKTYWNIDSVRNWWESSQFTDNSEIDLIESVLNSRNQNTIYELLIFIVRDITFIEKENFTPQDNIDIYITKIGKLISEYEGIEKTVRKRLNFFEWTENTSSSYLDKIYLISAKLISICNTIIESNNKIWVKSVFSREFRIWVKEINDVINKFDMIDDWKEIEKVLVEENDTVEWKSSFYRPLEYENPWFSKTNITSISKTIISMMNSYWWDIIIWFVEKPKLVINNIKIHKKLDYSFYDISDDLNYWRSNEDKTIRRIQDNIVADLEVNISDFDHLFKLIPISLIIEDSNIIIYKIKVFPSERPLYTVTEKKFLSLRKRVTWRNEEVLPKISDLK